MVIYHSFQDLAHDSFNDDPVRQFALDLAARLKFMNISVGEAVTRASGNIYIVPKTLQQGVVFTGSVSDHVNEAMRSLGHEPLGYDNTRDSWRYGSATHELELTPEEDGKPGSMILIVRER